MGAWWSGPGRLALQEHASEFNGDFAWSDYVRAERLRLRIAKQGRAVNLQRSSNGPQRSTGVPASSSASTTFVHFYTTMIAGQPFQHDGRTFMVKGGRNSRATGVKAGYGPLAAFTYAVRTSNGGYQVRRRGSRSSAETL
jgi:hypothetical protein